MEIGARVLTIALWAFTACASPRPAPPPTESSGPTTGSTTRTTASAPDAPPSEAKDLGVLRAASLCTLEPAPWTGTLSLSRDGAAFATVSSVTAALSLGADGEARWAVANIDPRTLSVRGITAAPRLFLGQPTVLAGFFLPRADAAFEWNAAVGMVSTVEIAVNLSPFFATPLSLQEPIACADLTLKPGSYDPRSLLRAEGLVSEGVVGGEVELHLAPNTPPIAKTKAGVSAAVYLLTPGKDFSRVLIDVDSGFALGWIESRHINRGVRNATRLRALRAGVAYDERISNQCARDLTLLAEVGGERAAIGSLKAGAAFKAGAPDAPGKLTTVALDLPWLRLMTGATFSVPSAELAQCGQVHP